jgi:hypothetical protein
MSAHSSFLEASKQAEHSLSLLEDIPAIIRAGRHGHYPGSHPRPAEVARNCLEKIAELAGSAHSLTIGLLHDELAAVAGGGIVRYPRSGNPHYHTSAHELMRALWLKLSVWLAAHPNKKVPADLLERLGIAPANLRVALVRERLALLGKMGLVEPTSASAGQAPPQGCESLTDDEYTILRALRDRKPILVFLNDLATNTCISEKTCGIVVASLVEGGWAMRRSERSGATITPAGEEQLKKADARRSASGG